MDKESVLQCISDLASQRAITKEELVAAYYKGRAQVNPTGSRILASRAGGLPIHIDLPTILYYIGGAVVFLGIAIFIGKNWAILNSLTRILITLGSGIVAYTMAVLFSVDERFARINLAFYLIAALILPVGLYAVFDSAGMDAGGYALQALNAMLLAAMFFASYFLFRKNVLLLFGLIFSSWLYFDLTFWFYDSYLLKKTDDFLSYMTLLAGVIYALLGYFFSEGSTRVLTGVLYSFGIIFVLGAGMCLTGDYISPNHVWEIIYPLLTFAAFYLSIQLESKSFLVFGAIFLVGYILKMASEYYTGGPLGPLLLIFIGLVIIAVGYGTFYIHTHYLKRE